MTRPISYEEAARLIPRYMRPGLRTNLTDPGALRRDKLQAAELESGFFILRQRRTWSLLNFLMTEGPVPELPDRVVTELVFGPRDSAAELTAAFERAGFRILIRRVRLTRPAGESAAGPVSGVCTADPGDLDELLELLRGAFDEFTGCIPGRAELSEDIAGGRVLALRRETGVDGLLRYKRTGRMAEIRQLAVNGPNRGRGLAGALVEEFLARNGGARCTVWTGSDNGAALAVYQKRGFIADGYTSSVMMKG